MFKQEKMVCCSTKMFQIRKWFVALQKVVFISHKKKKKTVIMATSELSHITCFIQYDFSFPFDINVSCSESKTLNLALLEMRFPCEMINYEQETIMIAVSFQNVVSTAMNTGLFTQGIICWVILFLSVGRSFLGPNDSPVLNELHYIIQKTTIECGFMYVCFTMISQYVRVPQWGCVYLHE